MTRDEVRWVAQRLISGTCRSLLVVAAVAGFAGLLQRAGPSVVLSCSLAMAAVACISVVLWDVVVARCRPEGVVTSAGWLMVLLFANSLAFTAPDMYSGVFIGLTALVVVRARLTDADTRGSAEVSAHW